MTELTIKKVIAVVDGPFIVVKSDDKKVALCRCGQSKNKPLCDGEHKQCNFKAAAWMSDDNQ